MGRGICAPPHPLANKLVHSFCGWRCLRQGWGIFWLQPHASSILWISSCQLDAIHSLSWRALALPYGAKASWYGATSFLKPPIRINLTTACTRCEYLSISVEKLGAGLAPERRDFATAWNLSIARKPRWIREKRHINTGFQQLCSWLLWAVVGSNAASIYSQPEKTQEVTLRCRTEPTQAFNFRCCTTFERMKKSSMDRSISLIHGDF